jgi:ferredoxin
MSRTYTVKVRDRAKGVEHTFQVPEDRYILHTGEKQGIDLPFSCRNGACTTCAVRVVSGEIYQPEAVGLSYDLRQQGYALLCVSYARSDLEVETQDEDEVYELQFGRYFGKGKVRVGLPLDED